MDRDLRDPVGIVRPGTLVAGDVSVGALLEYAWHPLVQETVETGEVATTLSQLVAVDLSVAFTAHERVRLEAALPLFLASFGESGEPRGTDPGDLRLATLLNLLSPEATGVGFGLYPFLDLPTGASASYLGQRTVAGGALAVATLERGKLTGTANFGAQFNPTVADLNLSGADTLLVGLAGSYAIKENLALGTEIWGRSPFQSNPLPGTESPFEWLGSVRWIAERGGFVTAGLSTALSPGVGAPGLRAVVGGGWARQTPPTPRIEMATLAVSAVRNGEAVPGLVVHLTGPEVDEQATTPSTREVPVGSEWAATATLGPCVAGSGTAVAHAGQTDLVIDMAPNRTSAIQIRVRNASGQPIADATALLGAELPDCAGDRSSFPLGADGNEVERVGSGFFTVRVSAPGHVPFLTQLDLAPWETRLIDVALEAELTRIVVSADRLVTLEPVHFETGKATILPESFPLLDEIAVTIASNPQLGRVRVEGHTDSQGGEAFNVKLSKARAEAIVKYLVDHGVPTDHVSAQGWGASRPLTTNRTEQGRAQNRRVEFVLVDSEKRP